MSIRLKIILVVLPLIVAAVVLAGMTSYFVAASSVTRVATQFLSFKASELEKYAEGQWSLLVDNGYSGRPDMETAARAAVESFARSILRSQTESIAALDEKGSVALRAGSAEPSAAEAVPLLALASGGSGFTSIRMGGSDRVASYFPFKPFGWLVFVTEERGAFYGDVETIFRTTIIILAAACVAAVLLLLLLARYLTRPLEDVSQAMRRIISSNDLSERVPVEYKDEIGQLSQNFNLMLGKLGEAYKDITSYAFAAAVAKKKETKIRNIFQLYVPKDVIEEYFQNPESMLVGNNRLVSVLFSDIRSFTTISEKMEPDDLVNSLNRYFGLMVDTLMERGGVVDKYIGDAIMAIFGAPTKHADDALRSVLAGLEMTESLEVFNVGQRERGKPEFRIGVGINYGVVTVGNIGCDKKMNYTVIGDAVNLASRLEGATKMYHQPLLMSQAVRDRVADQIRCRQVDKIAVKGKSEGISVYTARSALSPAENKAWEIHEETLKKYYARQFAAAIEGFQEVATLLPGDYPAAIYLERAKTFAHSPPPDGWDGVEVLTEK
ncbi:MAG: adenylate/guanylate cyclase domain-containing protein [Rectinemataceae bacterium]|jgi:class 3 adenylate cyclase/HAMP domain-containing protein